VGFSVPRPGIYDIYASLTASYDYGVFDYDVGPFSGARVDLYSSVPSPTGLVHLGRFLLATTSPQLVVRVAGSDPRSNPVIHGYGIDNIVAVPVSSGSQVSRRGNPPNPDVLILAASRPTIGYDWAPFIDHSSFMPNAIYDYLLVGFRPANVVSSLGTILLDFSQPVIALRTAPGSPFTVPIPLNNSWVGTQLLGQGLSISANQARLTNALDAVIGN